MDIENTEKKIFECFQIDNSSETFDIDMEIVNNEVVISGNRIGLISLASYIIDLALHNGDHIHLDESNFFISAKNELILVLK